MNKIKYNHKEAFCLMNYTCKSCGHTEVIWNSRDGVTPFCMRCPSCDNLGEYIGNMCHSYWNKDTFTPDYKLNKYQKYWRDGTIEEAIEIMKKRLESADGTDWEKTKEEKEKMLEDIKNHACKPYTDYSNGIHPLHEFQKGWPMLDIYTGE